MYKFETKKDYKKAIRSTIELIVLLFLLVLVIRALFIFNHYVPYNEKDEKVVSGQDHGFVAISYFGVDRDGSSTLISTQRLEEHLKALHDNGYVTITQDDIIAYYEEGKPLPDKALYLMYEDGRKDTAIFAQKIMEDYNDHATIMSYAEKFETKDSKFLMPKDLEKLAKSSYWDLGTNGYRLSYINVFDRYHRYIGELSSTEFSGIAKYLNREYNQYLMDYIRDENRIPLESYSGMKNRITNEYDKMESLYMENFGYVPKTYVLMHSNTGAYANNDKVSAVNEENMLRLFKMNFNREGYSINTRDNSIYDLTRMQPQAYWYTNHLLMRIKDDLPEEERDQIVFVDGDLNQKKQWEMLAGETEFSEDVIAITSESEGKGLICLKDSSNYKDIKFEAELTGNKIGTQMIHLRANEDGTDGIMIMLQNNIFYVYDFALDKEPLCEVDLYYFDGNKPVSIEEDSKAALIGEYEALAASAGSAGESVAYYKEQKKAAESIDTKSVEEGSEEYVPTLQIRDLGDRQISIELKDNLLNIELDGKKIVTNLEVSSTDAGYVLLGSAWGEYGYSQRNISDDVYDGVFEKIKITDLGKTQTVLYSNQLTGNQGFWKKVETVWTYILNWFIKYL